MRKYENCVMFLLIMFVFVVLSSCSSMMTIGTAAFVTKVWNDPRTVGTQLDDNILKVQIYHALYQDKQIRNFARIANTVYQGNVLLTGQSPSSNLSQKAVQVVMRVNGIKKIYNAIRLGQPISLQQILLDSFISNQVRLNLFTQKNIHITKIKVISENQEVFLLGELTREEAINAERIAKRINGVKNVFTIFT